MTTIPPQQGYANSYGWDLPATDRLLDESPYRPLEDPAENLAERLLMLAHLGFNQEVWGADTGRLGNYWNAYAERIASACNNPTVVTMWDDLIDQLRAVTLRREPLRYEQSLLVRPATLPMTPVADADVLTVIRTQSHDLVNRVRMWVAARADAARLRPQTLDADLDIPA